MEDEVLSNEKIAELIGKKMYEPSYTDTEFAFQLFVEKMVCPKDRDGYTDKDMEKWVLNKLNSIK